MSSAGSQTNWLKVPYIGSWLANIGNYIATEYVFMIAPSFLQDRVSLWDLQRLENRLAAFRNWCFCSPLSHKASSFCAEYSDFSGLYILSSSPSGLEIAKRSTLPDLLIAQTRRNFGNTEDYIRLQYDYITVQRFPPSFNTMFNVRPFMYQGPQRDSEIRDKYQED
ncbi:hypothetical protein B0H13DRAFT_1852258 [Mycena leptocephala]|nr:hypothetical protein B0H13DRAFT_1852258 [Mycena leptocephala]